MHTVVKCSGFEKKDFSNVMTKTNIFSEKQFQNHMKLYEGYTKKCKEIMEKLKGADKQNAQHNYSEFRELKVEETYSHNGVVLHELFFSNLTDMKPQPSEEFRRKIEEDFGSWENYITDLKATAKSMRGWAITAWCHVDCKFHNYGLDTHNQHVPMEVTPLAIIDVYEHAYMIDFATDKLAYIDHVMDCMAWDVVSTRYNLVKRAHECKD